MRKFNFCLEHYLLCSYRIQPLVYPYIRYGVVVFVFVVRKISLKLSYFLKFKYSVQPMKISDLIDDCLQNIFERLTLEDLINVAKSNFVLNVAACFMFARRYGSSVIIFTHPPEIYVGDNVLKGTTSR